MLVLLSTMTHLGQVRALSRAREESAGQRLYTSIKYGSDDGPAEESATEPEESATEPEESPAESEAMDPITAALQSGHFDEEAFLRSTSGERGTQGDGDAAPGGEDLPEGEEEP